MTHSTTGLLRKLRTAAIFMAVLFGLNACDSGNSAQSVAAITAQPTDQSVVASTAATFTVVATDATSYQWQSSTDSGSTFVDVSGATSASYTTAITTLGDSGTQYRVVVTGASNSVTSSAVTLTVTTVPVAPAITAHPSAQTITEGQNASFSVTATGTSLDYQWQQSTDNGANFANVAGATNATLALTLVPQADNAHQFRVVVSNSVNSVTSNAALLTVTAAQTAPAFSTQPANQSVIAPDTATFNVTVTGSPGPTLQWQVSTNVGSSFADIAGATASSYTTAATVAGDNSNQYRVVATNGSGSTASNIATLTVNLPAAPGFTTQPADVTITEGQNAQFTVVVTGTPTPTLQWQVSTNSGSIWGNINGETGTTYTAVAPALANNGRQFRAVASNSEGSVNSNAAVLTVTAAPPVSGTTLVSVTPSGAAANNTSGTLSLSADGNLVAFLSGGTDLVSGITSGDHAYLRNIATGVTTLINRSLSGVESTAGVQGLKLAAGGRYAVFTSLAGDLVAGDTNGSLDVFLRDLQTGITTRLNVLPGGTQITAAGNAGGDLRVNISADGRWVTFISGYDILGNGDPLSYYALFLRDTQNNVTRVIASDSATQTMGQPAISNDGRYVVYGVTDYAGNGQHRLMRYDIQLVTTDSLFTAANDATSYFGQGLSSSDNGRYVSFSLRSSTLFSGAAATHNQVVVLDSAVPDTDPGRLTIASTGTGGVGDGHSGYPVLSGDGRYVAFGTRSPNLTGDPAATIRSYLVVRDLVGLSTTVASRRTNGTNVWLGTGIYDCAISGDGAVVGFVGDNFDITGGTLGNQVYVAPRP